MSQSFIASPSVEVSAGRSLSANAALCYAFRMALIHNPQFAGLVNDIVVEAGNSLYQDVMDKFVAGEDVPYDSLRRVWQDTTQPGDVSDKPIYEEFYRAVRALNSGLPRERRLRVLLGDRWLAWLGRLNFRVA